MSKMKEISKDSMASNIVDLKKFNVKLNEVVLEESTLFYEDAEKQLDGHLILVMYKRLKD